MNHLKSLLREKGVSQTRLAQIMGRDKSAVTNMFQGKRQLKADEVILIAQYLKVPEAVVLGTHSAAAATGMAESKIRFQVAPSAEKAQQLDCITEEDGAYYLTDPAGNDSDKTYALEISDDSMVNAGLLPGDIIIAEVDGNAQSGDIVIAQHYTANGSAQTLVRRYEAPYLKPASNNPAYAALNEQTDDVRIVSPVVRMLRLLK